MPDTDFISILCTLVFPIFRYFSTAVPFSCSSLPFLGFCFPFGTSLFLISLPFCLFLYYRALWSHFRFLLSLCLFLCFLPSVICFLFLSASRFLYLPFCFSSSAACIPLRFVCRLLAVRFFSGIYLLTLLPPPLPPLVAYVTIHSLYT